MVAFNFRQNVGYVTDGTGENWSDESASYPTTYGAFSAGWETSPDGARDRNASIDRRIAGMVFGTGVWRIALAAGDYEVQIGCADATFSGTRSKWQIKDDSTVVLSMAETLITDVNASDASGDVYSHANWPGSQSTEVVTIASGIFRLEILAVSSNTPRLSHVSIVAVASGAPAQNAQHNNMRSIRMSP